MDNTNPKLSFIPKGSLIRDESFLERRRPQSVMGIIAISAFVLSIGSYVGLYFYSISLSKDVGSKTEEINRTQKIFSDAPQVERAKLFRARAELARELLESHIVISPVFDFLSKNTVSSIYFDKFSFTQNGSLLTVQLNGSAPNYEALAYQSDVLENKSKELLGYSIKNIALTKTGGILFTLDLTFVPGYLSYAKNKMDQEENIPQVSPQETAPSVEPSTSPDLSATSSAQTSTPPSVSLGAISTTTPVGVSTSTEGVDISATTGTVAILETPTTGAIESVGSTDTAVPESVVLADKKTGAKETTVSFLGKYFSKINPASFFNELFAKFKFW